MENKFYYTNVNIMNNIVNSMRFRCNAFLNVTGDFDYNVHNIVVSEVQHLINNMLRFYFIPRKYNIYSSVARYDFSQLNKDVGFPPFSFNLGIRKKQGEQFNKINENYKIAYDFVFDFDVTTSFYKTYDEVSLLKNQLDFYDVGYILRFSGRGFHVVIPYKNLPDWLDKSNLEHYARITRLLSKLLDLSSLDLSIYDNRRVIKTAYSIDNRSGYVCLPLNDMEFKTFKHDYCLPENVLNIPDLFFRNATLRQDKKGGFEKFLKERGGIDGQIESLKRLERNIS